MTLKGRYWVMLWLVVALGTLGSVAARQSSGFATARELRAARDERAALEAQRGEIERRIRQASSRQVLVPRVTGDLGLHEPAATEMTVLVLPTDAPGGLPTDAVTAGTVVRADTVRRAPARPRPATRAPAPTRSKPRAPARSRPRPRTRHR